MAGPQDPARPGPGPHRGLWRAVLDRRRIRWQPWRRATRSHWQPAAAGPAGPGPGLSQPEPDSELIAVGLRVLGQTVTA